MSQNHEIFGTVVALAAFLWWTDTIRRNQRDNLRRAIRILLSPSEPMYIKDIRTELSRYNVTVTDRTLRSVIREMLKSGEITRFVGMLEGPNQPVHKWRLLSVISPRRR